MGTTKRNNARPSIYAPSSNTRVYMMATLSTLRCVISFSSSSSSSSSVKSNNKNHRVIGRHQKYRTFLRAKRDDEEKNDENSKLPEFRTMWHLHWMVIGESF